MASRSNAPLSFSSIQYSAANKDTRWYVGLPADLQLVADLSTDAKLADIVNDIVMGNGNSAPNAIGFGDPSVANTTPHGEVVVAFRIPQTKRILDFVMEKNINSDFESLFDSKALSYEIYVSGRSDKKYSEIIDWVKVCDNTDQQSDKYSNVFLPHNIAGDQYVMNSDLRFHAKCFPYYTSWVKIVFTSVRTVVNGGTLYPDVSLAKISLHDFIEDLATAEAAPTIAMVFPDNNSKWLPSQTVYFTARAYEPNTDACHFSFDIYKETTGNTDLDPTDTLMYTIDSNELNLDGSVNENYTHTWHGLPVRSVNTINRVFLPGYPASSSGVYASSVLVVPTAGASVGSPVSLENVKFYDNIMNKLKYDSLAKGTTFTAITIAADGSPRTGWLINFKDSNNLPTNIKFNRIDFSNPASGVNPTKVEVYYCTDNVSATFRTVVDDVWDTNEAGVVFRSLPFVSKIEFCWPKVGITGNYDPALASPALKGYKEGLVSEITEDPDSYNPDRNGFGIDQSNEGDWTIVPKFSGLMVGPAFQTVNTTTSTYTKATEYGDSPVPADAANSGEATIIKPTGAGIVVIEPSTLRKDVAQRIAYVRVSLPDPYQDGDRFYAKCKVWDGRTRIV